MKTFHQYLSENTPRTFVLVMGGAGVGKNHYIQNNPRLKGFQVIDIDEIKKEPGVTNAMEEMKRRMDAAFKAGINVVHPTIGGVVLGNVNKLKLAKQYGYTTEVIYLESNPDRGMKNIEKRVASGGHNVPAHKVQATYNKSAKAYPEISAHADKSVLVKV